MGEALKMVWNPTTEHACKQASFAVSLGVLSIVLSTSAGKYSTSIPFVLELLFVFAVLGEPSCQPCWFFGLDNILRSVFYFCVPVLLVFSYSPVRRLSLAVVLCERRFLHCANPSSSASIQ